MKALSIKQPWASLIAHGIKDIENRTWKTNFRGKIFIHASADYDKRHRDMSLLYTKKQYDSLLEEFQKKSIFGSFTTSAIIGEVDIIDCVINHQSVWAEKSLTKPNIDNYRNQEGGNMELYIHNVELWKNTKPTYNWVLANAKLYDKPILNLKGKLSFWEPEPNQICSSCSEKYFGVEPEYCCSGRDCGCMGRPIEPDYCDKCLEKLYEKG